MGKNTSEGRITADARYEMRVRSKEKGREVQMGTVLVKTLELISADLKLDVTLVGQF